MLGQVSGPSSFGRLTNRPPCGSPQCAAPACGQTLTMSPSEEQGGRVPSPPARTACSDRQVSLPCPSTATSPRPLGRSEAKTAAADAQQALTAWAPPTSAQSEAGSAFKTRFKCCGSRSLHTEVKIPT